jgi:hypothetical protein
MLPSLKRLGLTQLAEKSRFVDRFDKSQTGDYTLGSAVAAAKSAVSEYLSS